MPGAVEDIQQVMKWAGLQWQEGPGSSAPVEGNKAPLNKGPYFQSERLDIYSNFAKTLLEVSVLSVLILLSRMGMPTRVSAQRRGSKPRKRTRQITTDFVLRPITQSKSLRNRQKGSPT